MNQLMNRLLCFMASSLLFYSCKKNQLGDQSGNTVPQEVIAQIKAQGFNVEWGVSKVKGGYIVEGDIFLPDETLEDQGKSTVLRIAEVEQYSTTNLIRINGTRTITVSVTNLPQTYVNAVDIAISRYNALNLRLTLQRVASGGEIDIRRGIFAPTSNQLGVSGGFPSAQGDPPTNPITLNVDLIGDIPDIGYLTNIITHEIGHTIGFRHTDYYNRTFSECSPSASNDEGQADIGAIHIPGTPVNGDSESWMLACTPPRDRPFNANDIQALRFLYGQNTGTAPSDPARATLKGYLEQVISADGRRYDLKNNVGHSMQCLKVISNPAGGYLAIYHTLTGGNFKVNIATSLDLLNWTWVRELAGSNNGSAMQPTIAVASDGGFVTAWQQEPNQHIKIDYYSSWNDLRNGNASKTYNVPRTLTSCAEGTPNIYSASSHSVDIGFHYASGTGCGPDREGRGILTEFNSWRSVRQQYIDNAIMHWIGTNGNVGDRDIITFSGFQYGLFEGQSIRTNFGTKRSYLYDYQTGNADPLNIITNNGSVAFANPTITQLTVDGQPAVVVTLFIPSEGAGSGEAGQLIYYKKY